MLGISMQPYGLAVSIFRTSIFCIVLHFIALFASSFVAPFSFHSSLRGCLFCNIFYAQVMFPVVAQFFMLWCLLCFLWKLMLAPQLLLFVIVLPLLLSDLPLPLLLKVLGIEMVLQLCILFFRAEATKYIYPFPAAVTTTTCEIGSCLFYSCF